MTTLTTLDESFDKILSLEQQTGAGRAAVHEALVNLLQSRSELSSSGAMLSAATRTAMGKRGIAQLEACKGLLDMAADAAAVVRGDATRLRDEVRGALDVRDEALRKAAAAEETQQQTSARAEAEGAAQLVATNELVDRAEREAAAALTRAEAAELRAETAERNFTAAERARAEAAGGLGEAVGAREEADQRLSDVASQLTREREVLAKVMAENVAFVKKLEFVEGERERAVAERDSLRTAWRQQTEGWFAKAADEMQATLLQDWGAADGLLTELTRVKHDREASERSQAARLDELGHAEGTARAAVHKLTSEAEATEAGMRALRDQLAKQGARLEASQKREQQLLAQSEVRGAALAELQQAEASWRERGEADMAERLALRAANDDATREAAALEEKLTAAEEQARSRPPPSNTMHPGPDVYVCTGTCARARARGVRPLTRAPRALEQARLLRSVNERVRQESSEEHGKLLEAQAKLEHLEQAYALLSRQNTVLMDRAVPTAREVAVG